MSRRDDSRLPRDMVGHARSAIAITRGRSRDVLHRDRGLLAACERFIEIAGEAAAHVSEETKAQLPFIPWHEIVGTRNFIAHGYWLFDPDILWDIIPHDLPTVIVMIEALIGPVPESE